MDPYSAHQSICIIGDDSLFDVGVTHLLTQETNFLVSNVTFSDDLAFLSAVIQNPPDVILICESMEPNSERILDLISSHPVIMGLPVVVIRLSNNVIDIYERPSHVAKDLAHKSQRIIATNKDDFINAIRSKYND